MGARKEEREREEESRKRRKDRGNTRKRNSDGGTASEWNTNRVSKVKVGHISVIPNDKGELTRVTLFKRLKRGHPTIIQL